MRKFVFVCTAWNTVLVGRKLATDFVFNGGRSFDFVSIFLQTIVSALYSEQFDLKLRATDLITVGMCRICVVMNQDEWILSGNMKRNVLVMQFERGINQLNKFGRVGGKARYIAIATEHKKEEMITSLQYHNKWLSCNNAGNLFAFYSFSYIAIYWSYKNDFAKNIIASYCHLIGHYEPK